MSGVGLCRASSGAVEFGAASAWAQEELIQRGPSVVIVGRFIPAGRTATSVAAGTLRTHVSIGLVLATESGETMAPREAHVANEGAAEPNEPVNGPVEPASGHPTWLELFFDLVIVAAIFQLAHRLQTSPSAAELGFFVLLYLATWVAWTSFTLYANVAGQRTRREAMLLSMVGIAIMAAAVPEATGDRGAIFASAYVGVRILAVRSWALTRQMLFAWPSVQGSAGITPWFVSIWVPAPARYALWGLGLAIDVLLPIAVARGPVIEQQVRRMLERQGRGRARQERRPGAAERRHGLLEEARLDLPHLAERLGLFVIIVLGEAVLQVVIAASGVPWTGPFAVIAAGCLALLVSLWWPIFFRYGVITIHGRRLPIWALLPLHFVTTASITMVAAGLGGLVGHAGETLDAGARWLLCGGVAGYYAAATAAGGIVRAPLTWLLGWGLPGAVAPVLLGFFGWGISNALLLWALVAVAAWQAAYGRLDRRAGPPDTSAAG